MSDQRTKDGTNDYYRSVTDGDLREPMELDEFLTGVGVVMRLPPKQPEMEAPAPEAPAAPATPRAKRQRKTLIVAVCSTISALIIMGMAVQTWDNSYSDTIPPTLVGSWHTDAAKYKDRGFTITNEALTMQRGPNPSDAVTMPIKKVTARTAQRGRRVEVSYEENGVTQIMTFILEDLDGMSIVSVLNQPDIVWKRK